NHNQVDSEDFSILADSSNKLEEEMFMPAECDMMLRDTWFDCEENEDMIKTVDDLFGIYEYSIGRGANLLINAGPNRHGLLNEADITRLSEFGDRIRATYDHPMPYSNLYEDGENSFT